MHVIEDIGIQSGYEALAPTTATGFTASLIKPTSGTYLGFRAKAALINIETHPVRFRMDGTAPTAANGVLLPAETYLVIIGANNVANFQCIDTAAGASSVKCLFFF